MGRFHLDSYSLCMLEEDLILNDRKNITLPYNNCIPRLCIVHISLLDFAQSILFTWDYSLIRMKKSNTQVSCRSTSAYSGTTDQDRPPSKTAYGVRCSSNRFTVLQCETHDRM